MYVLEAAVEEDAMTAAGDAILRMNPLRLGDYGGRRVGALMDVLQRIQEQE